MLKSSSRIKALSHFLVACATILCMGPLFPAEEFVRPSIPAVRTYNPPSIDGKLDDPCWADAPVVTDFWVDDYDRFAVEQTTVRILYDDENLYLAYECEEPEPDKIQGTERKDDRMLRGEDYISVYLDTLHDKRTRYSFSVNTLGTRLDGRYGLFGWNGSWDCDWLAECRVGEDKWVAELSIPIGNLLFVRGKNVTWGINFRRSECGLRERSRWSYKKDSGSRSSARHFGDLTGLDLSNVKIKRRPDIQIYTSGTLRAKGGENEFSTGVDLSLRLTPKLISTFTLNPDFGQVEADSDTIELLDTERTLPERRPFFRDGAEIFETPIDIYYSRRFVDIDAGAKFTGAGQKWNYGMIDVEGEILRNGERRNGNFLVGRITRNINDNSHIGLVFANSQRDDGYNIVGGLDSRLYLTDSTYLTTQVLGLIDKENAVSIDDDGVELETKQSETAHAFLTSLRHRSTELEWMLRYVDISSGFRPDLGQVKRRDIRGPGLFMEYDKDLAEGPIRELQMELDIDYYQNHSGDTVLRDFSESFGMTFRNELSFEIWRDDEFHAPYQNWETGLGAGYNMDDKWRSIRASYACGVFEDVSYDQLSAGKPFKVMERWTSDLEADFRREYERRGDQDVWLWRWVNEYNFDWDARLKCTLEQTSEDRHNVTVLFTWEPRDNLEFYAVLNDWSSNGQEERALFSKVVYHF